MAFVVKFCRRRNLLPHLEPIQLNPPAVITRKYEDQCGCHTCCSYPNNVWAILPAQLLTAIAVASSATSIVGCRLIEVPNTPENGIDAFTNKTLYNGTIPTGLINNNATFRSLGLFGWEDIQSECSYDFEGDHEPFSIVEQYWKEIGSDFLRIVTLGVVVVSLGLLVLSWLVCVYSCVAHTRRYRNILVALLLVVLPLLQSLVFRVLATDFCQEKDCQISDSAYSGIAAIVFYFLAGLLLCIATQDFPGNPYKKRQPMFPSTIQRMFGHGTETSSNDTNDNSTNHQQQQHATSPTMDIEMSNYHNGFADAVEIPVESEFIDRTLIDSDAVATTDAPQHHNAATSIDWTEFARQHATSAAPTTVMMMMMMSDNDNSTTIMSPDNFKTNV